MCYHNSINTDKRSLEKKYKKKLKDQSTFKPVFHANAFEHKPWPIISLKSDTIDEMNWGLIPSWIGSTAAGAEIRKSTPNARIETLNEKPSFRNAQRCLVPSTGFFEWQSVGNSKIPYFIHFPNQQVFSMAGIYDVWINEKGEETYSFSIVTTKANDLMASIHNTKLRMPVILDEEKEQLWFNTLISLDEFATPYSDEDMQAYTIGSIIGSKNHNSPEVISPKTAIVSEQLNLF